MKTISEGFKGEKAIVLPNSIKDLLHNNQITKLLHITHIGYYPDAKHHYRDRKDGSPENILIYCNAGKGWIEHRNTRINLSKNQIYIIPKNEMHSYGANANNPWTIYWLHFGGENENLFSDIYATLINLELSDSSRYEDRLHLFDEIYQNFEMGYSPANLEYISFCFSYFLASIKYVPQYREINKLKMDDAIQKSILYMKENLSENLTLDDIATNVNYSKSHLTTLFSQKTSYSPMVYFNQLRIQRACSLLQFSNIKIKEIAYSLGYYDPFHFSKSFSNDMGMSPSEYRKQYQEEKSKSTLDYSFAK